MMPHLTLEYSQNLRGRLAFETLFDDLHQGLSEATSVEIRHFKSRARCCDDYRIGDGSPGQAFVHLGIRLLDASVADKQSAGDVAIGVLERHVASNVQDCCWQLTVDLGDLDRSTYRKTTGGTRP